MNELIVSYIILAGECHLPALGTFKLKRAKAGADLADKLMNPYTYSFVYTENSDKTTEGLLNYVALKMNWTLDAAKDELKVWSHQVTEILSAHGEVYLPSLGTIKQGTEDILQFVTEENLSLFAPVPANRVTHTEDSHSVLVGDRESNTKEMDVFLHQPKELTSSGWWVAAIVMFGIGLLILIIYLVNSTNTTGTLGNQSGITPQEIPATYNSK